MTGADAAAPSRRPWARRELAMLATLLGLSGVAIAQPVLSVFGESPQTFVFFGADRGDIVMFAWLVALAPPAGLWLVGLAGGLVGSNARRRVHLATVALLGALVVLQIVPSSPTFGWLLVVVAVAAGVGFAAAVDRWHPLETWTRYLAVLPLLAVGLFLYTSPVADLRSGSAVGAETVPVAAEGPLPSLVVIVFDELPTGSLLDERGEVDASRYPNFAALAGQSTWYRGYSTLAAWSDVALPPMLTGLLPDTREALYTNYPDNLFSLFAGTHDLLVSESFSAFCAPSLCADAHGVGRSLLPSFDRSGLYSRARDTWIDQIDPGRRSEPTLDDFTEIVATVPPSFDLQGDEAREARDARVFPENQPVRFQQFLTAASASQGPTLYYLHLVLPHSPWRFHPDGTQYVLPAGSESLDGDRSNDWVAAVNRERHLLQTRYVDRLLGEIRSSLTAEGIWDEAVVTVVADHGVSFVGGEFGRDVDGPGVEDVLLVPLFVKAPGQSQPVVDDTNLWSVDLLPTLATAVGLTVPWEVDGLVAGSPRIADRGDEKPAYRFNQGFERGETAVLSHSMDLLVDSMMTSHPPAMTGQAAGLDALYAGLPEAAWLGSALPDLGAETVGTAEVRSLDLLTRPAPGEPPVGVVMGRVDDPPEDVHVLVVFDGVVVGVGPLVGYRGEDGSFVVVLPPESVSSGPRDVQVALLSPDGTLGALELRSS